LVASTPRRREWLRDARGEGWFESLAAEVPLAGLEHHLQFLSDARKEVGIDLDNEARPPPLRCLAGARPGACHGSIPSALRWRFGHPPLMRGAVRA
jgi:hypothetical protein